MQDLGGKPVGDICAGIARSFVEAKLHEPRGSVALYQVSSDLQGILIAQELGESMRADLEALLRTSPEPILNPTLMSAILIGAIAGVSRRLVESPTPESLLPEFQRELEAMMRGYATWATSRAHPH